MAALLMQERRTSVRVRQSSRMQYCAPEDLLPRDGRLANVSDRGVGLRAREPHAAGSHMTLSFDLPGAGEPLTATGVVRWTQPPASGPWHTVGLQWLPLDEPTRNRLQSFLADAAGSGIAHQAAATPARTSLVWWAAAAALGLLALITAGFLSQRLGAMRQERSLLVQHVAQKDIMISVLQQREQHLAKREVWLQRELGMAKSHLVAATAEVARLDGQAQQLSTDAQRLSQEVSLFQQSYAHVQSEREQLMQQVLNLEQERVSLQKQLTSLPALRVAVREAIDSRRQAQREARQQSDARILPEHNQGYMIRDGRPAAVGASTMWIKVHEPQSAPDSP